MKIPGWNDKSAEKHGKGSEQSRRYATVRSFMFDYNIGKRGDRIDDWYIDDSLASSGHSYRTILLDYGVRKLEAVKENYGL